MCLNSQWTGAPLTPCIRTPAVCRPVNWRWATLSYHRRVVAIQVIAQKLHATKAGFLDEGKVIGNVFQIDGGIRHPVSASTQSALIDGSQHVTDLNRGLT